MQNSTNQRGLAMVHVANENDACSFSATSEVERWGLDVKRWTFALLLIEILSPSVSASHSARSGPVPAPRVQSFLLLPARQ